MSDRKQCLRLSPLARKPNLLAALIFAFSLNLLVIEDALAQSGNATAGYPMPDRNRQPAGTVKWFAPNTMMDTILPEVRRRIIESSLASSPYSVRELINLVTYKVEARPGLAWDDIIASMKQRANKINLKFIGSNSLHREIEAITDQSSPRVEIYHFCDALLARELLDFSLEFAVILPCRIAVVEDATQKIWLMMLDWDVSWFDATANSNKLPVSLSLAAAKLRKGLEEIIQAGANGSL